MCRAAPPRQANTGLDGGPGALGLDSRGRLSLRNPGRARAAVPTRAGFNDAESALIPQRLTRLERELNSFLGFLFAAQGLESLALQVEQVLFADGRAGRDISAAEYFGDFCSQFESSEDVFARSGNICAHDRRLVAGAHQFQRARLGVGENALAVHGDAVGV